MNCSECKELLVGYIEELLTEFERQAVESHLELCPPCRAELTQLTGLHNRLTANGKALAQSDLENKVLSQIVREQSLKLGKVNKPANQFQLWRKIMKSRVIKLAAAAVIIIGVLVGIHYFGVLPAQMRQEFFSRVLIDFVVVPVLVYSQISQ